MNTLQLQNWWSNHRNKFLLGAIALMALVAVLSLTTGLSHLLRDDSKYAVWEPAITGANDLKARYREVHAWFAGTPVYGKLHSAVYPPASYAVLWLFLGWLPLGAARGLWALTGILALSWLVYLAVRASLADRPLERALVALLPLSMLATGRAFGTGQLIVHVLPAILTGILLICQGKQNWRKDLLGAILVLLSLVSPTIAAPFFWIVIFVPGRLQPAATVSLGYVGLTVLAGLFQNVNPAATVTAGAESSLEGVKAGAVGGASVNVHTLLAALNLQEWNLPISLTLLCALGVWVYYNRRSDLWLLLGVTAVFARLWIYHRSYNNLLILIPMIVLFRIIKQESVMNRDSAIAGGLIALNWTVMILPNRVIEDLPQPWSAIATVSLALTWLSTLLFLSHLTQRKENVEVPATYPEA
jgi:hypothetical protein